MHIQSRCDGTTWSRRWRQNKTMLPVSVYSIRRSWRWTQMGLAHFSAPKSPNVYVNFFNAYWCPKLYRSSRNVKEARKGLLNIWSDGSTHEKKYGYLWTRKKTDSCIGNRVYLVIIGGLDLTGKENMQTFEAYCLQIKPHLLFTDKMLRKYIYSAKQLKKLMTNIEKWIFRAH